MGKGHSRDPIGDFIESQYANPGHRTGRGVGEALLDLARHTKPEDLRYPLLPIGMPLLLLATGMFVYVLIPPNSSRYPINLLCLSMGSILGMVLCATILVFFPRRK